MRTLLMLSACLLVVSASSQSPLGNWRINEKESFIIFVAKNLGLSVSGKISGMQVTGSYQEANVLQSSLTGSIDVATLATGIDLRDNHLKSSDYFDIKKYPKIIFKTKSITSEGGVLVATGELTIKGVTKEEAIRFTVERKEGARTFTGDITILRKNYELGSDNTIIMADTIRVRIFVVFEPVEKN